MARHRWHTERKITAQMLSSIRERAGLTQVEVAARLSKPQSHVSKYESGDHGLEMHEIRDVCLACDVEFADFAKEFDARLEQSAD